MEQKIYSKYKKKFFWNKKINLQMKRNLKFEKIMIQKNWHLGTSWLLLNLKKKELFNHLGGGRGYKIENNETDLGFLHSRGKKKVLK